MKYIYIYYFHFINFLRTCTAFNFSVNSQKWCESYRWLYSQIRKHGEREMRFRAAFRVCESRNRAPLLLQPQASRSFSQLPLFKPPTVRVASLFSVYVFFLVNYHFVWLLGKLSRGGKENRIHDMCLVFFFLGGGEFWKFILTILKLLWNENFERL